MISGQIQELLSQASRCFVRATRAQVQDPEVDRADAALAKFGIFTESRVDLRSLEVTEGSTEDAPPNVVVIITATVKFVAPDGSARTVRSLGKGTGDLQNATADAAEDAYWKAMKIVLDSCDDDLFSELISGPGNALIS